MKETVKIIPLGGLGEIGKNMTVIEYRGSMYIVDAGLAFPDPEMHGVDVVIPNFDFLRKNREKLKAIIITHAHEDHIGALPYFLKEFDVPLYASKLTAALIKNKLKNNKVKVPSMNIVQADTRLDFGSAAVSFFSTNHSIPDSLGVVVETALGAVVHTGDFKIDYTPLDQKYTDFRRLGEIGKKGVLVLLSDSTNATKEGMSDSEKKVGKTLQAVMRQSEGRIVVATFASSLHRVQNLLDTATLLGRKVVVVGKSMENNVATASKLGYLKMNADLLISPKDMDDYKDHELLIITTGAQGEPNAGLARMASGNHAQIQLKEGDTVLFSSSPIPGNEKSVGSLINDLLKKGVHVVDRKDIHTSGHGFQEEQKLMLSILRPTHFIPVHGEYRMLRKHAEIATDVGIDPNNILLGENGNVIELTAKTIQVTEQIDAKPVFIDYSGKGEVDVSVMRDRQRLSTHGVAVVQANFTNANTQAHVNVVLKGIVGEYDKKKLSTEVKEKILSKASLGVPFGKMKRELYEEVGEIIYRYVKRKPMIVLLLNNFKGK